MPEENKNANLENCDKEYNVGQVTEDCEQNKKTIARMPLSIFVVSMVAILLAAVMLTFTLCSSFYKIKLAEARIDGAYYGEHDEFGKLELIAGLIRQYGYAEQDEEAIMETVIRTYIASTGDRYAAYYTLDEYIKLMESSAGNSVGIGITVELDKLTYQGEETAVLSVVDVTYDGPAYRAGIEKGDAIAWIGNDGNAVAVGDIDYNEAMQMLRGDVGSVAEFTVIRDGEKLPFSVTREKIEIRSAVGRVLESDPLVGRLIISEFNYNTPHQFCEELDKLLLAGCKNIVFDLRGNPGGDLGSITAILSYFLEEGDVILSTKDASGNRVEIKAREIDEYTDELVYCNVSKEDIGKYRGKIEGIAVLCDGMTASAAELFTSVFRDYGLSVTVGVKTYGKGSMQSIVSLLSYGYSGAIKFTTKMYFPPCGEGYDGIGIMPTEGYVVELSEEAKKYSLYSLPENIDAQLQKALEAFN